MKVNLTAKASARQIAELHRRIAEAKLALDAVAMPIEGPPGRHGIRNVCPLQSSTRDALHKLDTSLHMALLSLEGPMARAVGILADGRPPTLAPSEPNAWHRWLDALERPKFVKVTYVPQPPRKPVIVRPVYLKPGAST